jgi:hypothetical protein
VRLFGYLVWRVRFLNVGTRGFPSIGYRLDLKNGKHSLAILAATKQQRTRRAYDIGSLRVVVAISIPVTKPAAPMRNAAH